MRDIYRWFLLRKANESTKERSAEVAKMVCALLLPTTVLF